jgi:hypothetical protein
MPKAGRFDYPARDLDDCISYLEKAHKVANVFSMTRENFANDVRLSPKGGGFGLLIGSMGMYGLVETGEGDIRYTDLCQKILFGRSTERDIAKNEAVRNVILFQEIFDRYGEDPTQDQVRHILREKADVPISQEADLASEIGKLFKRNAQHFKPKGGEVKEMRLSGGSIQSVSSGLFTVTASGLTIEVDSPVKLELVKKLVEDADKQFKQSSKDKERQESEKESK